MITVKNLLLAAAALLFALLAVAAFVTPGGAWPLCIAGIALLILAHSDRIAEISAGTSGAKIVLQQVQDKVVELRRLVTISARMHMAIVQRMGRWGTGFNEAEKDAIREESERLMRDAGVDEEEIRRVRAHEWDRYVYLDYVFWIGRDLDVTQFKADWDKLIEVRNPATPDQIEALLND